MTPRLIFLLILCELLITPVVSAFEEKEVPAELDFERRGAAMGRFEIPLSFTEYFGDQLGHSILGGGGFYYAPLHQLNIGADFGIGRMNYDPASGFGSQVTNKNLMTVEGAFRLNLPGAYRNGKKISEVDFYTLLGGGVTRLGESNRPTGFIGGGMKVYTKKSWFALRVEIRNRFLTIPTIEGSKFASDLTLTLGPAFQIPPFLD